MLLTHARRVARWCEQSAVIDVWLKLCDNYVDQAWAGAVPPELSEALVSQPYQFRQSLWKLTVQTVSQIIFDEGGGSACWLVWSESPWLRSWDRQRLSDSHKLHSGKDGRFAREEITRYTACFVCSLRWIPSVEGGVWTRQ